MKTNFSKSVGRLRGKSWAFLLGLVLSVFAAKAADSLYSNSGTIDNGNIPQIDATNFNNSGTWNISGLTAPYETADTLNYTNTGTMTSSVGWEFDFGSPTIAHSFYGGPYLSANFVNGNGATIQANDGSIYNPPTSQNPTLVSYLLICATNIVNKGTLIAGASGEIILSGANVNLSHSGGLEITPIAGGVGSNGLTNFVPDTAIYDEYWTATNNNLTVTGPWWNGVVLEPFQGFGIGEPCGVTNGTITIGPLTPNVIDSFTTNVGPHTLTLTNNVGQTTSSIVYSNIVNQGVFVYTGTNNGITGQIRFTPSLIPSNAFCTVAIQLTAGPTNVITEQTQTNAIYIVDSFASSTNHGLNKNTILNPAAACSDATYRPAAFVLSRTAPSAFTSANSFTGAGVPPPTFFYDPLTFTNFNVTGGSAAAYSALIDNVAAQVPAGSSETNLPGRVRIYAGTLNLNQTRVRAEGEILIQASNLTNSVNAVMDCQNLSFDLGSTNGQLNFVNLAGPNVSRLQGTVDMYSAVWSNAMMVVYPTNYAPVVTNNGTSSITNWVQSPLTNFITVNLALTAVDASGLSDSVRVTVQDLSLHSTNIVMTDSATVDNSFLLDGQTFTLLGDLFLFDSDENWTYANAPNLLYFTNNGELYIPNNANFGNDRAVPYTEFVNNGIIISAGQTIDSLDIQIVNGINYTFAGDFSATARSIEITGPPSFGFSYSIYSANDIDLTANTLVFDPAALYANGALNFTVTNTLSDNGTAGSFTCYNGFNLWIKPTTGDLLGSTVTIIALNGSEVDSYWAGQDRGQSWTGFSNNVAIGTLVLSPQVDSQHSPGLEQGSLFTFTGAGPGPSNALYVTTLDLSQLTSAAEVADTIQIAPNMKIYYSQIISSFTPPNGLTPEEFLTTQFGGSISPMPNLVVTQSGTVDENTVYQRIDGFGASSAWRSVWTTNLANMFFSTNMSGTGVSLDGRTNFPYVSIGLSLLRTRIAPGGTTVEQSIMTNAQARGAQVWSVPWSPAAQFKSNGNVNGGSFVGNAANYQAYANQQAGYVANMKSQYGVSLYAISVQNEPDANVTTYESCNWTAQQIHDFVPYLSSALANNGMASTKIMLPESQNWPDYQGLAATAMSDSTSNMVGIIADHNYDGANGPPSLTKNSYGKALWQTEVATFDDFNPSIANGVYWAGRIHAFLTVAQVNAWHYWWLVSQNPDNEGLTDANGIPAKRMYTLGNFSRFVRPGYHRIGVNPGGSALLVSAYMDTTSSNFAIVAINTNINVDVNQTFNLLANFPGAATVTPWITSFTQSLASQPAITANTITASNLSFSYTIPAMSVVTFVGQAGLQVGSLQVTITPAAAVSAGAQWQVDGGTLQNSGTTVSNLSVGSHTLTFNPVNGWGTPASQTVTIIASQTATATGTYAFVGQTGSLQVMISPPGAITAGAMWQVDGGAFQNSGAIVSGLSASNHTVAYEAVSGFITPSNQSVTITTGFTNLITGIYLSTNTNKPAVAITAPTANQSVSNVLFTVTGTVTDKVAVAGVYYSLDNSPWTNAVTGNNWTNWSAAVTLIPGTNTIAAYAVDNNGNVSTTNKVSFVCVLNAMLSVSTNGLGSLSTNYNGRLLQIGKGYSIKATAAKGFAFTNWTGGTNLPLSIITNNVTIQFLMQANLMLQANFVDVTKPTNTITVPASGQHMTNALATILGKATDNWGVSGVWYQLNNGVWSQAATTNGWTNWTTTVKLVAGTNTIKAYALDWGGNYSATNNVSFVSSNTFKLQLGFTQAQPLTDKGLDFNLQISPGLNGHIQISTNLLTWTTLTNFVGTNSTLNFSDLEATNFNRRFYRAVIP